ncbi:class I SAM-dependent methyltransferase [Brevibacillus reuszeri]|uniref:class I SAM-dependent methyltransferase n=1 Tax=Brevibacillus reuszeri TaxID=54915 RepID=UPI002896C6E9|nr:class I SAM-dependent methyltransferase [Brevibacillus reuszeri]
MSHVVDYYSFFGEKEWTRLDREPLEFLINWHYMKQHLPGSGTVLDIGAGPGKYSLQLAKAGYRITLADLTPKLVDLARQKATEFGLLHQFQGFHVADARDLSHFPDEAFDASLMLGPMYHLQKEQDRAAAAKELHRVTQKDGIVFVAFRSRSNHIMSAFMAPENWKPHHQIGAIHDFYQTGIFDHAEEGRFTGAYFYPVDEISPFMESFGFQTIQLIGSTNIGAVLTTEHWRYWQERGEAEKVIQLLIETATDPALLGMSSHLLYIGKKAESFPR